MRNIIKVILIILFGIISINLEAQRLLVENQYFINPWVYNPAQVGESPFTELSFSYKKQWVGLDGAPARARLSAQARLGSALRVGGGLWQESEGPFSQIQGLGSIAYALTLSNRVDHRLQFGMSLGIGHRSVNLNDFSNPNDPSLASLPDGQSYMQGSLGMYYRLGHFELGVSVPRLVQDELLGSEGFASPSFAIPEYFLFSTGYHIDLLQTQIRLHPQLLYHRDAELGDGQLEGMVSAYYKDQCWLGTAYRQNYGMSAYVGAQVKERYDLSYIYSFSSIGAQVSNPSHEIVLRIRVGKNKDRQPELIDDEDDSQLARLMDEEGQSIDSLNENTKQNEPKDKHQKKSADKVITTNTISSISYVDLKVPRRRRRRKRRKKDELDKNQQVVKKDTIDSGKDKTDEVVTVVAPDEQDSQNVINETEDKLIKPIPHKDPKENQVWPVQDLNGNSFNLQKGFYLVCGAFSSRKNALRFQKNLGGRGLKTIVVKVLRRGLYYVYTGFTDYKKVAQDRLKAIRQTYRLQNTWVLVVP